jgi:ribosome-associated translation inhibitor RaiA
MIRVIFKNLEKSELAHEAVEERLGFLVEKFEDLKKSRIGVTLEMENSPLQAGPDLFKVKVQVRGGRYDGVLIEKSAPSLYVALAEVVDRLLERLNRYSDKLRVKSRSRARRFINEMGERAAAHQDS